MNNTIDFVIPWVDGSDREWLERKAKYNSGIDVDANVNRYRDWGTLKYWFRGVEKFAPWVNHIYFICDNKLPDWLNVDNEKLTVVRHEDYIPQKYLPTFSANPIELNLHRIKGLSDQFVYFNDDTFVIKPITPEFFFKKGIPCDDAIFSPIIMEGINSIGRICANNMRIINAHFDKKDVIKTKRKWYTLKYGKQLLRTIALSPWHHLTGFYNDHLPQPFLKSTFEEVWKAEPAILDDVSTHKFRDYGRDVNQWLLRYWQFCKEQFVPTSPRRGKCFSNYSDDAIKAVVKQQYSVVCFNDPIDCDFEKEQKKLIGAFEQILPEKSSFEK